jgi:succinate dehydrogenase/fumarate reductase flavoprotein subunit
MQIVSTWRETVNMLKVAELVIAAALQRRESRGSHWRRDYDFTDPTLAGCHYVFQPMGNMDKEVFPSKAASNRVTTPLVLGQQKEVMSHASCNG